MSEYIILFALSSVQLPTTFLKWFFLATKKRKGKFDMKQLILLTTVLMISNMALACGGITITGKSSKTYCLSKFTMNWYSAYAWCKDQGRELIELEPVCKAYSGTCSELDLSSDEINNIKENGGIADAVWTNTSKTASNAHYVYLTSGDIKNHARNDHYYGHIFALCY